MLFSIVSGLNAQNLYFYYLLDLLFNFDLLDY